MSSYKKLAKDSVLFFIANFGSKLISFLIVPYYTYALTTAEYGTIDVISATIGMIAPLVTFGIGDVITLYLVQKKAKVSEIFFVAFSLLLVGNILIFSLLPFINYIDLIKPYIWFFFILIVEQSFYGVLQSFTRGLDKLESFVISGIMYTLILVCCNVYFLTFRKMGAAGYLLSMLVAYTICDIYLAFKIRLFRNIADGKASFVLFKSILKLSIPLLPNAMLWWLMNLCDKYSILYYIGVDGNGVYTIANKIPTILFTLYSILQQAWQLTSMEIKSKDERSKMSSELYNIILFALTLGTIVLSSMSKILITKTCESSYHEAWKIVPILLICSTFNSLSSFFGTNYILMGNTFAVLKVTVVGTIINAVGNIALVPIFGLKGAAFATALGFIYMTLKKAYDTRIFNPIKIKRKRVFITYSFLIIGVIIAVLDISTIGYLLSIILSIILILTYKNELRKLFGVFVNRFGKIE